MIPAELIALPQWVAAGADKVPIDPKTGAYADVSDPRTWGTHEQAKAAKLKHVGFVFTEHDPYCAIDLDKPYCKVCQRGDCEHAAEQAARHRRILEAFPSYTEVSQSGEGMHVIVRGHVPRGVKRDRVELDSQRRYMIFTANVWRDAPIIECQETLDALFAQMAPAGELGDLDEAPGVLDDRDVFETALRASNGEKFDRLCRGEWEGEYTSQSEADFALLSILAFYTRDNAQVRRLFRMSGLGKRDKAQRDDYLNRALSKIRSNELPLVDLSALMVPEMAAPAPSVAPVSVPPTPPPLHGMKRPPGLVGELAQYIYESSSRPVAEVSTCAALAFLAGVIGRQYNISGTGLNLYIIMLAKTGIGKEEAASGIDRIITAVRPSVPMVDQFIGPGAYASGQAVIRTLDEQPSLVSILGEFGLTLQNLSGQNADSTSRIMRRALLDLYNKSGWGKVLRSSAYSDREKNTKTVVSPALTLLGESTPETFYAGLTQAHISDGLVPRFLVVEYKGERPARNRQAFGPPTPELVKKVSDLVATVLMMANNQACCGVAIDAQAQVMLDDYDAFCDTQIRIGGNQVVRELWNRAHLKTLRLSALLAVGVNPMAPLVTAGEAQWAMTMVTDDVERMVERFDTGDVGEGDSKQLVDLARIVREYIDREYGDLEKYGVTRKMHAQRVIPYSYLIRRTASLSSYRGDRRGATAALKLALETMVEGGNLQELPKVQTREAYGTSVKAFYVPP